MKLQAALIRAHDLLRRACIVMEDQDAGIPVCNIIEALLSETVNLKEFSDCKRFSQLTWMQQDQAIDGCKDEASLVLFERWKRHDCYGNVVHEVLADMDLQTCSFGPLSAQEFLVKNIRKELPYYVADIAKELAENKVYLSENFNWAIEPEGGN